MRILLITVVRIASITLALLVAAPSAADVGNLLPRPASVHAGKGALTFDRDFPLVVTGAGGKSVRQAIIGALRARGWAGKLPMHGGAGRRALTFTIAAGTIPTEGYRLSVTSGGITIKASTAAGAFYAGQTLLQILPDDLRHGVRLDAVEIADAPRFAWRGLALDTVRHFMPKSFIMTLIDQMAAAKMNRLQLSLTNDQGWRFAVPGYPRLIDFGSKRAETLIGHYYEQPAVFDGVPHGGYYTDSDIRDIVAYADRHFVTIVPEVNFPGHAGAALAAYSVFGADKMVRPTVTTWGVPSRLLDVDAPSLAFSAAAISRAMTLFPGRFIHLGGDEVVLAGWRGSPAAAARRAELGLQNDQALLGWFINQNVAAARSSGRTALLWDDTLASNVPRDAIVMAWHGEGAVRAAIARGNDVIVSDSTRLYFDYAQSGDDQEPIAPGPVTSISKTYGFDPVPAGLDGAAAARVLGVQAALWTEYVPDAKAAAYMIFPRLAALAEIGWTPQPMRNWDDFARRLPAQIDRYTKAGIEPSLSAYGVQFVPDGDRLRLTTEVPVETIRFTVDGSDPVATSRRFESPISLDGTSTFTAASFKGSVRIGPVNRATLVHHIAYGHLPLFRAEPDRRYFPSLASVLVDGRRGGSLLSGRWQSFTGVDLNATIDLGDSRPIRRVAVNFALMPNIGAIPPTSVLLELSDDGVTYHTVGELAGGAPTPIADGRLRGALLRPFVTKIVETARFVRILATQTPPVVLADGRRQPLTIAADEIVIE